MRTRTELVLRWTAATAAILTLAALGAAAAGLGAAAWAMLGLIYVTGVSYGLSEMVRLFQRHKRRCRDCLEGAGPHLRWWAIRLLLVLLAAALPALLILPLFSSLRGG
ncbi:MAG: hypothetical protein ACN0LA_05390 [Candidatus Longimicrobiales bacterium M2_2A_002]